jgi:anti-sigma regulatory factor (Ser/Thr protein kinase)
MSQNSKKKTISKSRKIEESFQLIGGNFSNAGEVPIKLKQKLVEIGVQEDIISRAGIAAFEAEMNVIIHAGSGIENIELAMQEGFSTAPEWVKEMGWGAGMGLPNIKKNSDDFRIDTVAGEGTTLEIIINLNPER